MVQDSDLYCLSNNSTSKMQIQGTAVKDSSRPEEPKTKDPKLVLPCDNPAEPAKKEDKQKRFKRWQKRIRESKETPAIDDNTVDTTKKKKSVTLLRSHVSTAIRKATMPAIAPSQKTSVGFGNLRAGDWWWWGSCQGTLHPSGPIPKKIDKSPAW